MKEFKSKQSLKGYQPTKHSLAGTGDVDHNMKLSKDRVDYLKKYFIEQGKAQGLYLSKRITTNYVGSSNAGGSSTSNFAADRKVSAEIQSPKE